MGRKKKSDTKATQGQKGAEPSVKKSCKKITKTTKGPKTKKDDKEARQDGSIMPPSKKKFIDPTKFSAYKDKNMSIMDKIKARERALKAKARSNPYKGHYLPQLDPSRPPS